MFFRRQPSIEPDFEERLKALAQIGFEVARLADGRVKVSRDGCAAVVSAGTPPRVERAGWLVAGEIALLVDEGFQKFWNAPGRRETPALASQLKALHEFEEDLREGLGLESLYNTSLGTTNDLHTYDRVEGRE
jgi:hypothetical protein